MSRHNRRKSAHWLTRRVPRMKFCYSALALFFSFVVLDAQLVCWQALLRCHDEPECDLAYSQYLSACEGNIRGNRRQCPSHCISALVRLNQTVSGPGLETCDCGQDALCRKLKQAIEPCLPRTQPGGIGCTAARQRCEEDASCQSSLTAYLTYCGQLFNGRKCSSRCKSTIQQMLFIPNGMLLNQCVCDGVERPFCEVVKENMSKLCNIGDGGVPSDHAEVDYVYEDEDYEFKTEREMLDPDTVVSYSGSPGLPCHMVVLLLMVLTLTL
ncbi:growth arrest-specific protein 1 [Alosa pseudoharengus]|uniref:growth arrest-specific protein 1 n=1 Tax=Alosa pseudoharengus TaxID=34774 RepID=UPI003F8B2FC5